MAAVTPGLVDEPFAENDAAPIPRIIGNICPGCLRKPCECPVDEGPARDLLTRVIPPVEGRA